MGSTRRVSPRMLIWDRENWPKHRGWLIGVAAATAAATMWYLAYGFRRGEWSWPGGASPPGLAFGVVGGGIILFEMLLWPRKSLWRGRRLGRTKYWMIAHLWLGLLTLPILILHGSFHFNPATSPLAAVLMILLVVVVASGVFGAVLQNIIPRLMMENVPAETIHSQIGVVLEQFRDEAKRLVHAVCGVGPRQSVLPTESAGKRVLVSAGSSGSVGDFRGRFARADFEPEYVPGAEPLIAFHDDLVAPFLEAKRAAGLALASRSTAEGLVASLKSRIPRKAHPIADRLVELCEQRRQFDLQAKLHAWLHAWLAVHVSASVALTLLMIVHALLALKYS